MGLAAFALLGVGVSFLIIQSLVPVLPNGLDLWIGSLFPVLGVAIASWVIVVIGLPKRRFWLICYVFVVGVVLLAAFVVGIFTAIAVLFRVVPMQHPELHVISIVNTIMWVVLTPFAWLLLRMLRLRYWQPWTTPETWEPGDETPPGWPSSSPRPVSPPTRKRG